MSLTAAATLLVALAAGRGAQPPPEDCGVKCSKTISVCEAQCAQSFPKPQQAECQRACKLSLERCLDTCKAKK